MEPIENKPMEDALTDIVKRSADLREEALVGTVTALRRIAQGLGDSLGVILSEASEGEPLSDATIEMGRGIILSWHKIDAEVERLFKEL